MLIKQRNSKSIDSDRMLKLKKRYYVSEAYGKRKHFSKRGGHGP
jgi:hypothetical protein